MADPFLGEIRVFPFTFAPVGWALCDGQLLPISQNTALFSLLGTTYGGNGVTTFALPDLRGAVPLHFGQGPGLTARVQGERGGSQSLALLASQIPLHTHDVAVASNNTVGASSVVPTNGTVFGRSQARATTSGYVTVAAQPTLVMHPAAVLSTGGGAPHNNMGPFVVFNLCIALAGIFPPRS